MGMQVADLFASLGLKIDNAAWKRGDALIKGVKTGLAAFASYEAVRGVTEAVTSVIDLGSNLHDTAQKTGLAVEALQEYGYIAKLNSSSSDAFAHGVMKLSRGLDEAATKASGPAYDALKRLKINITDPKWKAATLDEKIGLISAKLGALPDGVQKTALAMDLFGKSGAELIPTFNDIAQNGGALREEFKQLGGEITGDQASALDDLGDNLDKTKAALTGLKTSVVTAMLPVLKDMVEGLLAWVKANRDIIASGIKAVVTALVMAFKALGAAISVVADVMRFLEEHGELARAILVALGAVIGAVAVEAAAAWVVGFAPVIAVVAAITAVILVFQDLMKGLLEGKGVIASVIRWIGDKFKALGKGIIDAFRAIGRFFESIGSAIKSAFESVIDWITGKIEWAWNQIKRIAHYAANPQEIISDAYDFFTGDDAANAGVPAPDMDADTDSPSRGVDATRDIVPGASGGAAAGRQPPVVYIDKPTTEVNINADGASAEDVGKIVKEQIKDHHERVWRDVNAATGAADEE